MPAERDRPGLLQPEWPAPPGVRSAVTTRFAAGSSQGTFARCNLGLRSGEAAETVLANRAALRAALALPREPLWLRQAHGRDVVDADAASAGAEPTADAG